MGHEGVLFERLLKVFQVWGLYKVDFYVLAVASLYCFLFGLALTTIAALAG